MTSEERRNGRPRLVVGVDGSANAAEALRWAVREAELHDADVVALWAWSWLVQDEEGPFDPAFDEAEARRRLADAVGEAVGEARDRVALDARCDLPAHALVEVSQDADLVVVGARGHGGFAGLLLGSVAEQVAEHAACPVAVIRQGEARADGPIVVGADASAHARVALRWAAEEARRRGAPLRVVHAWSTPVAAGSPLVGVYAVDEAEGASKESLDEVLADPSLEGLSVDARVVHGNAAGALLDAAADAALVVVGSRGLGRIAGVLLGSTSRQVLHHAHCPVVVVHGT